MKQFYSCNYINYDELSHEDHCLIGQVRRQAEEYCHGLEQFKFPVFVLYDKERNKLVALDGKALCQRIIYPIELPKPSDSPYAPRIIFLADAIHEFEWTQPGTGVYDLWRINPKKYNYDKLWADRATAWYMQKYLENKAIAQLLVKSPEAVAYLLGEDMKRKG